MPTFAPTIATRHRLTGKTFVLTGFLPTLTRAEATFLLQVAGATVEGSVRRSTSYIVAGTEPGSKLLKAQELGVTILDESAFRELLGDAILAWL